MCSSFPSLTLLRLEFLPLPFDDLFKEVCSSFDRLPLIPSNIDLISSSNLSLSNREREPNESVKTLLKCSIRLSPC
jgi:hypothetical protein